MAEHTGDPVTTPSMPGKYGGTLNRGGNHRSKVHGEAVAMLRAALYSDGPQDRIGVIEALLTKARKGDMRAIELVLYYALGKPTEHVDMTLGIRAAASRMAEELGIDDAKVQTQIDGLLAAKRRG